MDKEFNPEQIVLEQNGFSSFNPMQQKALSKNLFEKNMVISAPTAAGKTIIMELAGLHSILNDKKKAIYTCPLRALASEHFNDFKKKYSKKFGIRAALSIGDFDSSSTYLKDYDIVFTTYEKLESLLRHRAEWLSSVGTLVVDEVHELDSDRGPTLEMVVTKMRFVSPRIKMVALSATIPNCREIAKWLEAELVESTYRPVKLAEGVFFGTTLEFGEENVEISGPKDPLSSIAADTLQKQKQALVFANTRKRSQDYAKKLAPFTAKVLSEKEKAELSKSAQKILHALEQPTEQCEMLADLVKKGVSFHHAGLLQKQREIVEELFRQGTIKIICSTPTLSAGINMPAFRVVIPSLYRYTEQGNQRIPVREYKQMCLPYESRLFTKEYGWLPVGEIVENNLQCSVLSMNLSGMKKEFKQVVNYFKRESEELVQLEFKHGLPINLTSNHPALISTANGFEWVPTGQLKEGDKLVSLKGRPDSDCPLPYLFEQLPRQCYVVGAGKIFDEANSLFLTQKSLAGLLGINSKNISAMKTGRKAIPVNIAFKLCNLLGYSKDMEAKLFRFVKSRFGKIIKLPITPTEKLLWLTGFIATDGTLTRTIDKRTKSVYVKVKVCNTAQSLIDKAGECFAELGIVPYRSKRQDGLISLEAGSTLLAEILVNHYGLKYGAKTTTVEVPKFLENASSKLIGAYLGGVFDGDGNINIAKQKRGNAKVYRGLVVTGSEKFASGIQRLMLNIGIISTIERHKQGNRVTLKGKEVFFSKPFYNVIFRKIEYMAKFSQLIMSEKGRQRVSYSHYHNVDKRDFSGQEFYLDIITKITKFNSKKDVYNIAISDNNNYFAESLLLHNCGRAGRPKFDSRGESIVFAGSSLEAQEIFHNYINGEIEEVSSKLGIESILRMHLLGLIASNFVFDLFSMEDFFSKTFYFKQFGSDMAFFKKISTLIEELKEMGFIEAGQKGFRATLVGKRVSELFLDPLSAHKMILALKKNKFHDTSYLFTLCDTSEMYPFFTVSKKLEAEVFEKLEGEKTLLPVRAEVEMYSDPNFMKKFLTALVFKEWVNETHEDKISKEFGVQPGIMHSKKQIAEWLSYSCFELSKLLNLHDHFAPLSKLQKRLKHGVREELLNLVELRGIGRVRARRLFAANIRSISDVKKTDILDLQKIIPPAVAVKVKEQLKQT